MKRGELYRVAKPSAHDPKNFRVFVVIPSFNYSVITNLDIFLIGMFFNGNQLTEFGEYGTTIYVRFKYSF